MSMFDTEMQSSAVTGQPVGAPSAYDEPSGAGWVLFAGMMLVLVAILNGIYGIAAIGKSSFFVHNARYIVSDLNTWGWVMLALAALQMVAAFSVWNGNSFGRWFGIGAAGLNAIGALMSIPSYPFWSLSVFAVDILIIYGLAVYGGQRQSV
jgi:hypothetical protein